MTMRIGLRPLSTRLQGLWSGESGKTKLIVGDEEWDVTGVTFKLKDGRVEATAFAKPPVYDEDELPVEGLGWSDFANRDGGDGTSGQTIRMPIPEIGHTYYHEGLDWSIERISDGQIFVTVKNTE